MIKLYVTRRMKKANCLTKKKLMHDISCLGSSARLGDGILLYCSG